MKALLLAGGLGRRLGPYTERWPKCLMPIQGVPLLLFWLRDLWDAGVEHVYVNTHHLADEVHFILSECNCSDKITIISEDQLLGTAGTLKQLLLNHVSTIEDDLLVAHADNFCLCDFAEFIEFHRNDPFSAGTMMSFYSNQPASVGRIEKDSDNRLVGVIEKDANAGPGEANGAVFIFRKAVRDKFLEVSGDDLCRDLIPLLIGEMAVWQSNSLHLDIGTPQALFEAQNISANKAGCRELVSERWWSYFSGKDVLSVSGC